MAGRPLVVAYPPKHDACVRADLRSFLLLHVRLASRVVRLVNVVVADVVCCCSRQQPDHDSVQVKLASHVMSVDV